MSLAPYQQRVLEERSEVNGRTEKLRAFVETPTYLGLDQDEQFTLLDQLSSMYSYVAALDRRIARFMK